VGATRFADQAGYGLTGLDIVPGTLVALGLKGTSEVENVTVTATMTQYVARAGVLELTVYLSVGVALAALVALLLTKRRA